jgi:hypothetical protein
MLDTALDMRFDGVEVYNIQKFPALTDRGGSFHKYNTAATVRQLHEKKLRIPCFDTSCDLTQGEESAASIEQIMDIARNMRVPYVSLVALEEKEELVREMNHLIPFKKYDLVSLGAADQPIELPVHKILPPGEVITLTCPQLGRLEIAVEDNRDPNTVMRGWSPRPYFLETN